MFSYIFYFLLALYQGFGYNKYMKNQITKTCSKCHQTKPVSKFSKNKHAKDGRTYVCKKCINKYNKQYIKSPRVKKLRRNTQLKIKYGITIEDYNLLYSQQQECCILCGIHQSKLSHRLHVDHDHNTKRIRGLLCKACNNKIGWFEIRKKQILEYLT